MKLITIEGLDASGKALQTKLLVDWLREKGMRTETREFPNYESDSSYYIKEYLKGNYKKDLHPLIVSLFYELDRFDLFTKMDTSELDYLVLDRYIGSNYIHQMSKVFDNGDKDKMLAILKKIQFEYLDLPQPDVTIFLKVLPKTTIKNMKNRGRARDIHEQDEDFIRASYNSALEVAEKEGWYIVDCTNANGDMRSIEHIHSDIVALMEELYDYI